MTLRRSTAFIRRGLASELADRPPKSNEVVHATDTGKVVIGDGATSFADLTAVGGGGLDESAVQAIVDAAVADLVNGAPGALNTLKELADALGDDASFAATLTTTLAAKAPLASPALTGNPTAPTQAAGNNSTRLATTAYTDGGDAARALLPGTGAAPDLWGPARLAPAGLTIAAAVTTAWPANNTALFQRLEVPVKRAYRYACFGIGTAAGNIQVGVVRLSGTSLLNYSVVMDSGVIACPAAADIRLDLGSVSLQAGDYAIFAWASSTSLLSGLTIASGANIPRLRVCTSVASLSTGVPSSGSLSDWAGTRAISAVIEADV